MELGIVTIAPVWSPPRIPQPCLMPRRWVIYFTWARLVRFEATSNPIKLTKAAPLAARCSAAASENDEPGVSTAERARVSTPRSATAFSSRPALGKARAPKIRETPKALPRE